MKFRLTSILLIAALTLQAGAVLAKVKLAGVFGDNMVLQRDQPVPVWGTADSNETVTVAFAGQQSQTVASPDGQWLVKLDNLNASAEDRSLIVISGSSTQTIQHVLVGEVWLCGGQSNMGLHLKDCWNGPEEIAAASYPLLHFIVAGPKGAWRVCSPETITDFAGVAYFFGRKLQDTLNIPIGLIEFDRGATGIEGWVPLESYQASSEPALQQIYHEVASWNPNTDIGRQAHQAAFEKIEAWIPQAKQALADRRPVPPEPHLPAPNPYQANPCEIFTAIVRPLIPYALRGAVWYQGESNPGEGQIYEKKMSAMITGWRQLWQQGDFPFYFVQLANEGNPNQDPAADGTVRYVPVREAQRRVLKIINTGLVVAIDLGEDANGHPRDKKDVGERLAAWPLARIYGDKTPFCGPLYRDCRVIGDRMILNFDAIGRGLMVGDKEGMSPVREIKDQPLTQFAICGPDEKWYWGDARIVGNTVEVRSDQVPVPVKVRYAYSMNPKGPKLYNRDGLPASPFRTDNW